MGDTVQLVVDSGRLHTKEWVRIVGITYDIGDDGQEDVTLEVKRARAEVPRPHAISRAAHRCPRTKGLLNMMPGKHDLTLYRGDTFKVTLTAWETAANGDRVPMDMDLTRAAAAARIHREAETRTATIRGVRMCGRTAQASSRPCCPRQHGSRGRRSRARGMSNCDARRRDHPVDRVRQGHPSPPT